MGRGGKADPSGLAQRSWRGETARGPETEWPGKPELLVFVFFLMCSVRLKESSLMFLAVS